MDPIEYEDRLSNKRVPRVRTPQSDSSREPSESRSSSRRHAGKRKKLGHKKRRFAGKSVHVAPVPPRWVSWLADDEEDENKTLLQKSPLLGDPGEFTRPPVAVVDEEWKRKGHARTESYTLPFFTSTALPEFHKFLVPVTEDNTTSLTSPTSPMTPEMWRYVTVSRHSPLGKGAFGSVYMARDNHGRLYAVKEGVSKPGGNLGSEIRHLLALPHHPNLVKIEGYNAEAQTYKLLLEYVDGGTIRSLYKDVKGALGEPLTGHLAKQVLQGLAFLHKHAIVHRDLKGANVLVGHNGTAKIADFGLAKKISNGLERTDSGDVSQAPHDTSISMHKGSWLWMAPECFIKTEPRGTPIDIWAFGCVLLECITGHVPWYPMAPQTLLLRFKNHVIPFEEIPELHEDDCGDFLETDLLNCLQWKPTDRFTAQNLLDDSEFLKSHAILSPEDYRAEVDRIARRNAHRDTHDD